MPRLIHAPTEQSMELAELVERLETEPFDPLDEENFASWGTALKQLSNNRNFLSDLILAELKQRCAGQVGSNQYSAQVIMLHGASKKFVIRANFWPALKDSVIRHSGTDPFFYHVPHDHNFSFLTVGYFGPGYWSDYYEYEYGDVVGFPGEEVNLRFVERSRLDLGKVMLYRAHRDVHLQLPADEMSVSINILETSHSSVFRDQYRFDVEGGRIDGIITRTSLEPLLTIAAHHGGAEGLELVGEFALAHPSERVRWCALRAQAGRCTTIDDRIDALAAGTANTSRLVSAMAAREIDRLKSARLWIEGAPEPLRTVA